MAPRKLMAAGLCAALLLAGCSGFGKKGGQGGGGHSNQELYDELVASNDDLLEKAHRGDTEALGSIMNAYVNERLDKAEVDFMEYTIRRLHGEQKEAFGRALKLIPAKSQQRIRQLLTPS